MPGPASAISRMKRDAKHEPSLALFVRPTTPRPGGTGGTEVPTPMPLLFNPVYFRGRGYSHYTRFGAKCQFVFYTSFFTIVARGLVILSIGGRSEKNLLLRRGIFGRTACLPEGFVVQ